MKNWLVVLLLLFVLFINGCQSVDNISGLNNQIVDLEKKIHNLEEIINSKNTTLGQITAIRNDLYVEDEFIVLSLTLDGVVSTLPSEFFYEFYLGQDLKQVELGYPSEFNIVEKDGEKSINLSFKVSNIGSNEITLKIGFKPKNCP